MQIKHDGDFVEFNMTPEEQQIAYALTPETKAWIQNLKAQAAMEIVTNIISPITGSEQDRLIQAKLQGQVEILTHILSVNSTQTTE